MILFFSTFLSRRNSNPTIFSSSPATKFTNPLYHCLTAEKLRSTSTMPPTPEPASPHIKWSDSFSEAQTAIQSLSSIITLTPDPLSSSSEPSVSLLQHPDISSQIANLLRLPDSGAGDNQLCRWLYDTFQSSKNDLQLVVLRFLPIISGVYLSRVALRKPLAGFEAVLLALYSYETSLRNGQAITVNIPDLSHSSIYHETKQPIKNSATELNLAVTSPSLEPHGTVRSTRRARIVGVALELYYSKIYQIPIESKIDFCEFCEIWTGLDGEMYKNFPNEEQTEVSDENPEEGEKSKSAEKKKEEGRIPLPWEILQPMLRILGHCLMGPSESEELRKAACKACRSVYARAMHDINPKAILAAGSLLKLVRLKMDNKEDIDHTEITTANVISF